jgi:protoporphyrinogen oxidase
MRVAVVGAGFTGLSAAVELVDNGVQVEVFERESKVGGLASGFKISGSRIKSEWSLEFFYHHIFSNDAEIIAMAKKVGLPAKFYSPITSSFINGKIIRLDSPISVLTFSEMSIFARVRMGVGLMVLKIIPNGLFLEKFKVIDLLPKLIGRESYTTIWEKLMKAKFGSKIVDVNMAWFWSRVAKRTKNLGYFDGGFESLAIKMKEYIEKRGGKVSLNTELKVESKVANGFDKIILTTPAPIAEKILGRKLMPKISYLWAQTLILELNHSLMSEYWLNILERKWPFLVAVEHTNFIDKEKYNGNTILYLGNYLEEDSKLLKMDKNELIDLFSSYLKKINKSFDNSWILSSLLTQKPFSQPVFPVNYSKELSKISKIDGRYLFANMSMVYPFDRGTNYAVKLGVDIAKLCLQ